MTELMGCKPISLTSVVMKSFRKTPLAYLQVNILVDDAVNMQSSAPNKEAAGELGKITSNTSTGGPQRCVLSPLLFSFHIKDPEVDPSVKLLKFADKPIDIGLLVW